MKNLFFILIILGVSIPLFLENLSGKRGRYSVQKLMGITLDASERQSPVERDYSIIEKLAPQPEKAKQTEEFDEQENSDEEQENEELEENA